MSRMMAHSPTNSQHGAGALAEAYQAKAEHYFAGARRDYIGELPRDANAHILEIGCGNGDTGALAISEGKCACYCGVELCRPAADLARGKISQVIAGDVESIELPWPGQFFDVLILSEVLEHLVNPWAALQKIRPLMKPGALVLASTPNVSHYEIVLMLLRGNWRFADQGVLDRTHLRWFTPQTLRQLFESCGYRVHQLRPVSPLGVKAKILSFVLGKRREYLFWRQIDLRARCQ